METLLLGGRVECLLCAIQKEETIVIEHVGKDQQAGPSNGPDEIPWYYCLSNSGNSALHWASSQH